MRRPVFLLGIFTTGIIFTFVFAREQEQGFKRFSFLQQLYFENFDGRYDTFLEKEIDAYLTQNPDLTFGDQLLWMQAEIALKQKKSVLSLMRMLKLITLFPNSELVPLCRQNIDSLVKDQRLPVEIVQQQERVLAYVSKKQFHESITEALLELFNFLVSLNSGAVASLLLPDIENHQFHSPVCKAHEDVFFYLRGILNLTLKNFAEAEACFQAILTFYPQSVLIPEARYRSAYLCYRHLKNYQKAQKFFLQVINYSNNGQYVPESQYYLAELYDRGLDSVQLAMENYRIFMDAYPQHFLFPKALKNMLMLKIRVGELEDVLSLFNVYSHKLDPIQNFLPMVDSLATALEDKDTEGYFSYHFYLSAAREEAPHKRTADYLYRAARIAIRKMQDSLQADEICKRLQENFPTSKFSKRCQELQKKR